MIVRKEKSQFVIKRHLQEARMSRAAVKRGLQMAAKAQPAAGLVGCGAGAASLVPGPPETPSFHLLSPECVSDSV